MSEHQHNLFNVAINELLNASYFATPEEVAPIFAACAALAQKYEPQIEAMRRERKALGVERALAEQGRRKKR
jgi:hypothetical protein